MISVLIPTKNEERDLPGCLESVNWCDDVHVYDSHSTDSTAPIACRAGAHVTVHPYSAGPGIFGGNEAEQKNWALRNITFKYEWVLHLDADERITPELLSSMRAKVSTPTDYAAFRLRRRDFMRGTWLKHVQASPYYVRLFRPERMRYDRVVNPVSLVDGPIGELDGYLDHFPFSKGVQHWIERHNHYSTMEARQILTNRQNYTRFSLAKALSAADVHDRRYHQKELFYRMPARPLLKFVLLYLVKGGFLDGRAGLTYALLQSFYEYMIVLKTRELEEHAEVRSATAASGT